MNKFKHKLYTMLATVFILFSCSISKNNTPILEHTVTYRNFDSINVSVHIKPNSIKDSLILKLLKHNQ